MVLSPRGRFLAEPSLSPQVSLSLFFLFHYTPTYQLPSFHSQKKAGAGSACEDDDDDHLWDTAWEAVWGQGCEMHGLGPWGRIEQFAESRLKVAKKSRLCRVEKKSTLSRLESRLTRLEVEFFPEIAEVGSSLNSLYLQQLFNFPEKRRIPKHAHAGASPRTGPWRVALRTGPCATATDSTISGKTI